MFIKVTSSEWCNLEFHEVFSGKYTIVNKDIRELGCVKGERGEEINIEKLVEHLKKHGAGADIVIIVECEYDFPHVILVHLKDRKIVHYLVLGAK